MSEASRLMPCRAVLPSACAVSAPGPRRDGRLAFAVVARGVAAIEREPARAAGAGSTSARRFGTRKYASNSASKRRHSSAREHSHARRLQRSSRGSNCPTRRATSIDAAMSLLVT
ncbi:MAG: hypothetical protein WDN30_10990 [Pararobbsia sp.]